VAGTPAAGASLAGGPHEWQLIAVIGGFLAFLLAGFTLRRGRTLSSPTQ
jgi:hypothetical protein